MKKHDIIVPLVALAIGLGLGWFGNYYYHKPEPGTDHRDEQRYGDKITTDNYRVHSDYVMFDITAEGPGGATTTWMRPDKWKSAKHIILANAVLGIDSKRILYGGEIMYYYMLLNHVGVGGGVGFIANDNILQGDYEGLIKAGLIFKW